MQRRDFLVAGIAALAAPAAVAAMPALPARKVFWPAAVVDYYYFGGAPVASPTVAYGVSQYNAANTQIEGFRIADLSETFASAFDQAIVDDRPMSEVLSTLDQDLQRVLRTSDLGPVHDVLDLNAEGVA